jgi:hypothetical protein
MKLFGKRSADRKKGIEHAAWLQECQAFLSRPDVLQKLLPIAKSILEKRNGNVICVAGDTDSFRLTYCTKEEVATILEFCPADRKAAVMETLTGYDIAYETPVLFIDGARSKWASMAVNVPQMEAYVSGGR